MDVNTKANFLGVQCVPPLESFDFGDYIVLESIFEYFQARGEFKLCVS